MAEPSRSSLVSKSATHPFISGDSRTISSSAIGKVNEVGSTPSRVATVAANSLESSAEESSAEIMRLQIQIIELQIRLREAETEALKAKTEMELYQTRLNSKTF